MSARAATSERPRQPDAADSGRLGLAVALAALAWHALYVLAPGGPPALDALARAVAYVLLPGWAAARRLSGSAGRGALERAVLAVGLGATLAAALVLVTRTTPVPMEATALALTTLSLASLAPRPSLATTSAPASGLSLASGLAGILLGALGLLVATSASFVSWARPLADLLAPAGAAEAGARAASVLCALLLAASGAALVRRWTHSLAAAGAVAILLAAGAGSMIFAAKARPAVAPASSTAADAGARP
jgi:hypothetical protein